MAAKTNQAKTNRDWSGLVWLLGWVLSLVTMLKKLAAKLEVPFEAFERLVSDKGEGTLERVVQLIRDDYEPAVRVPPSDTVRFWVPINLILMLHTAKI